MFVNGAIKELLLIAVIVACGTWLIRDGTNVGCNEGMPGCEWDVETDELFADSEVKPVKATGTSDAVG